MSTPTAFDGLLDLLRQSLIAWHCPAQTSVSGSEPHTIRVNVDDPKAMITIERAPAEMPFRWIIEAGGRKRTAASVVGVLRIVRQSVAPHYESAQVRIARQPGRLS